MSRSVPTSPLPPLANRLTAGLLAVLIAATVGLLVPWPTPTARGASFDPIPSTSPGANSAWPSVVAAGNSRYHAVARVDGLSQQIAHQLSTDGGLTWATTGRFSGDDGGATRPSLAVSGDRVAIGFLGRWCDGRGVCGEAPYVASSTNGGVTWGPPYRVGTNAFAIDVAVDGDRMWIVWDRGGAVEIRGSADGARSFFLTESVAGGGTPFVAADDGASVVAWWAPGGPRAVVGSDRTLGDVQALGGPGARLGSWDTPVAAADGKVHVLLDDGASLRVATAAPGLSPDLTESAAIMARGRSGSIAARRGLVAVAAGADVQGAGVTMMSTSSNGGVAFSAPAVVAVTPGTEPLVDVGVATIATDKPLARFDWTVSPRYVAGPDGFRAPADATAVADDVIEVRLDGCQSLASPERTITDYRWTVDGIDLATATCEASIEVSSGESVEIQLAVTDNLDVTSRMTLDVAPKDLLVVSIGDSIASGEGNPHEPAIPTLPVFEHWGDDACHRSALAGPAQAAARLEDADPRSRVTFVHLACSGAAVIDTEDDPTSVPDPADDLDTGGLLDQYHGIDPAWLGSTPSTSQVDQLAAMLGSRPVDALLLSIGANDVRFSDVVKECIVSSITDPRPCHRSGTRTRFEQRLAELPQRYAALDAALTGLGVDPARVHITEYFDPTSDSRGAPNLRCIANSETIGEWSEYLASVAGIVANEASDPRVAAVAKVVEHLSAIIAGALAGGLVTDDEAAWARWSVLSPLNEAVQAAATAHGWNYVGNIADRFAGHGYCTDEPWVVTLGESFATQLDKDGAFHPDGAGHQIYADAISASLRSLTVPPTIVTDPFARRTVGDAYVVTATRTTVSAAVVRDTGGIPISTRVSRLDRVALGWGDVGPGGAPAGDEATAVAAWMQLNHDAPGLPTARYAQFALSENVAVRSVKVVQAPEDAPHLIAERPSVVMATLDARLARPQTVDVTTHVVVTAIDGTQPREVVDHVTGQVRLVPGRNDVLLPVSATFTLARGEEVATATVTVTDPLLADPADEIDNTGTATAKPTAVEGRPMKVVFVPAGIGTGGPSCAGTARAAGRMGDFAADAFPLDDDGLVSRIACSPLPIAEASPRGVFEALADLDYMARLGGLDAVVAMVPDGWLQSAKGGAIGVAASGFRAVIVEVSAPSEALAHELAHTLGVHHTDAVPAPGARVSQRTAPRGIDLMNPIAVSTPWISAATWETLVGRLGGLESLPTSPDPLLPGVWVRGVVSQDGGGNWVASPATWSPTGAADQPFDTDGVEHLELDRLVARQVDADGETLEEDEVPMSPIEGLYAPGSEPPTDVTGYAYQQPINLHPDATAIQLVLDGDVVDERQVNEAPAVEVTAPIGGDEFALGAQWEIEWTASDPDGDPLTFDILASDDGEIWKPIAAGLTGVTSYSGPVPSDLGSSAVRIRVVASDGVRSGWGDSGALTVEEGTGDGEERIVFSHFTLSAPRFGNYRTRTSQLYTMLPDGSAVTRVPLPTEHGLEGYNPDTTESDTGLQYRTPSWGADGRLYFASNYLPPGSPPPFLSDFNTAIFSSLPDGTDLRQHGYRTPSRRWASCPQTSPDGERLVWYGAISDPDLAEPSVLAVSSVDGTGATALASLGSNGTSIPANALNETWPEPDPAFDVTVAPTSPELLAERADPACPRWSPDGTRIAVLARIAYRHTLPGETSSRRVGSGAVPIVIDVATGEMRVLADLPDFGPMLGVLPDPDFEHWVQLDWFSDGTLYAEHRTETSGLFTGRSRVSVDVETGALTPLGTHAGFAEASKVSPISDEILYGGTFARVPAGVTSWRPGFELIVIDLVAGTVQHVPDPPAPYTIEANNVAALSDDRHFDWGFVANPAEPRVTVPPAPDLPDVSAGEPFSVAQFELVTLDAGGSAVLLDDPTADVTWDLDGDGEFDDAVGPRPTVTFPEPGVISIRVRVDSNSGSFESAPTEVTVVPAPPAESVASPGAGDEVPALPVPESFAVTIPNGETTSVPLRPMGTGTPFTVVYAADPERLSISSPMPPTPSEEDPPVVSSGPDGTLLLTPASDFVGTTYFEFAVAGVPHVRATVTVEVTGNRAPLAADDQLEVPAGVHTVLPATAVTGNDSDPDGDELSLALVYGSNNGDAWVDTEGRLNIHAETVGSGEIYYEVRDPDGQTDMATIYLTVVERDDSSTTTTTTTTSTTVPATTTTTTTPPTTTTTTPPTTTAPPTTPPTTPAPATTIPTPPDAPFPPSRYVPLPPARLFDTRPDQPAAGPKGLVGPRRSIDVAVTGRLGIPHNAVAVVLNVTVTETSGASHVTVYPTGQVRPNASSINNIRPGQTRPNLVTVPIGRGGRITLYSLESAHLLADVAGYYLATDQPVAAGRFIPLTPHRIFDTRPGEPAPGHKGRLAPKQTIRVQVAGVGGVPSSGAAAVVVNLTGADATAAGFITAYPTGRDLPLASNVNLSGPGDTAPNLAIVPLGPDGAINIYSSHGAHALGDVTGYITDASATPSTTGLFVPLHPTRVFDTRPDETPPGPKGRVPARATIDVQVAGRAGVPATATGAVLNIVGIESPVGHLTIWPAGLDRPLASTLNFAAQALDTRANAAMLPLGTGGRMTIYTLNGGHLLADTTGYFL